MAESLRTLRSLRLRVSAFDSLAESLRTLRSLRLRVSAFDSRRRFQDYGRRMSDGLLRHHLSRNASRQGH